MLDVWMSGWMDRCFNDGWISGWMDVQKQKLNIRYVPSWTTASLVETSRVE